MYQKLKIDFDKKENELLDSAALESDSIVLAIAGMKESNTSNEDILASLDAYTQARIKTAANIARIDIDGLLDLICISPLKIVRPILAKSATRTVFQEKLQFETISSQSVLVKDLVDLPNGGKNALYIGARKSVDFVGSVTNENHEYRVLIAAKYTKSDGGAQDNQRNDLIDFAEHAPDKNDASNSDIVVLLADGPYYRKNRSALADTDFFSYIDSYYKDKRVIATTTEDFDIKLGTFLKTLS